MAKIQLVYENDGMFGRFVPKYKGKLGGVFVVTVADQRPAIETTFEYETPDGGNWSADISAQDNSIDEAKKQIADFLFAVGHTVKFVDC